MDEDLVAAAQRFSGRRETLEVLAAGDESFRALCADFAETQVALHRWRASASPVREQRCLEYEELVESLAGEIASYLDAAETEASHGP